MIVAIMTTALSGTVKATDFTLSSASSVTQDGITVSFAKGNGSTAPTWYAAGLRLYASNTITISSSSTITGVTFNWEKQGSKAFASVTASTGTYSHPSNTGTGTWSGSANSITFTLGSSGQLQLNTFSVTVGSATPTCADPTFSPAAGAVKSGTEVTISSSDGATIYYTTDGSTPNASSSVYSSPIEITVATTIKAFASKSGYDDSGVVTAEYTIMEPVSGYTIDFESDVDCYEDWTITNIGTSNTAITAHGGSKYGANINASGNGVSTASIQTKETIALPGSFTCYVSKVSNNSTSSTWTLEVSEDGTNWTDVATQDAAGVTKGEWTEFTANLSGYSDVYVRLSYGSSNAIRAIDDISITMRDPNAKKTPVVTIDATGITTTDIAGNANVAAGTLAATVTSGETTINTPAVTWSSSDTDVATVNATTGAVTLIGVGTATITASFAGNDDYTEASATYELTVIDSYAKGQLNNPYTVAEAIAAYDAAGADIEGVYVTGIVCTASSQLYSSKYLSYYISDDGTTNSSQLEAYNGLGLNGANFTSVGDVKVGDVVVIYGTLTYYASGSKYEMAANNHLVSLEREQQDPTIVLNSTETVAYGSTFTIDDTMIEGGDITVTSGNEAVATVEGLVITPVAVGTVTITVETAENATYKAGSETFELTVTAPVGGTTAPTGSAGGTIFEETFADCAEAGGNDNDFATAGTTEITTANNFTDNDGWSFTKGYPASGCVKFGGSKAGGEAATPSITATVGTTYTLTFKAAPWSSESATMNVSVEGGTISGISEDAMSTGEWNDFTASITATATSFTVTFAASKNRFFLDEVKIEAPASGAPTETYTIPSSGLGTYCSQYPIDLDELPEGVKAYALTAKGESSVTLTEITGTIKGGVGFILEGSGEVTFTFADSSTEPTNLLVGTLAPEYLAESTAYGLKSGVFQPNTAGTIKAHRAYLPADAGNAVKALTLIFEDDATGITHTRVITDEATIYDLTGRRLSQMQKGINIVNGKKILK